ncbi:MAG TPA: hypothetical protein VKR82_04700 [Candidatus Acidoferrales bacterium]|nr:hypothetical protein [Candidatus Acidoferrales bacterium]
MLASRLTAARVVLPRSLAFFPLVFLLAAPCFSQDKPPSKLIFKSDESTTGPIGGEKSFTCLRVFSDGRATYAKSWSDPFLTVDKQTGKETYEEHLVSKEFIFDELDLLGFSDFLKSKPVRKLPETFGPPHQPIDFIEMITLEFTGRKDKLQKLSTREFFVTDLEERARYPGALIVLMLKLDEIERKVSSEGKPVAPPSDCRLKLSNTN